MPRRFDLATGLVVGSVLVVLAGDACLARTGRRLVTDVLRTPPAVAGGLYLAAHVADVLGPFDLFKHAARQLVRSSP